MKAKIEGYLNTDRSPLHKVIPLDMPYGIIFEPTSYCNLKCFFCIHSLDTDILKQKEFAFKKMSKKTFDLFVDQLKEFPRPLKTVGIQGCGEPTLHEDLPYMIEQLNKSGMVERAILVTNGTLLTNELSKSLIEAGLHSLLISVNGLSSEEYLKNCGVSIDFDKYVAEISYLYNNRANTKIFIKTVDKVIDNSLKTENDFYNLFGDFCDKITIDKVNKRYRDVSYEKFNVSDRTQRLSSQLQTQVCPRSFFKLYVTANGMIDSCVCAFNNIKGIHTFSIEKLSLCEFWNSKELRLKWLNLLKQNYVGMTSECKDCEIGKFANVGEFDLLDPYSEEIYERIINLQK